MDGLLRPYFIELFDDHNVRIDDKISLKCVGTGHPIPMITWFVDNTELDNRKQEPYTLHKALFDEYIVERNRIVSYLNITVQSVFDGGTYQCVLSNKAGVTRHSANIRVAGPTKIRPMYNKNLTAMTDIKLNCPTVGDEPKLIEWHKDDKKLPLNHRHRVQANGTLEIQHLDKSDSGIYTCIAFGEKNSDIVKQSFKMKVKVPPVIEGFSFNNKLEAGMRTRIYCNVAQGDQPVSIKFYKDEQLLSTGARDDGITVQEVDPYSLSLAIANLSAIHNGNYSCVASNEAATVSYNSYLVVNVPPKWIIEPKNTDTVEGNAVRIDCSADGFPIVQITWKRLQDSFNGETNTMAVHQQYLLIRSGPKYQVFQNGSLKIANVEEADEGQYLCQGSNGIGSGLSTLVKLFVHIPAKFKESSDLTNISVIQEHPLELVSNIIGDHPISVEWTFNNHKILSHNSDYLIKDEVNKEGVISMLQLKSVSHSNSGIYKCIVINEYLKSPVVKTFRVIVKEPPEAPQDISIISKSSQTIALSWKRPYDGNDEIREYVIQYVNTDNETLHRLHNHSIFGNISSTVLRGLQPSTHYTIVMYGINSVGKSRPSKEIKFQTEEESPSGPPTRVQLMAIDANSIKVDWFSPPIHQINGELKGFYIGYKALNTNDPFIYKTVQIKGNPDLGNAFSLILQGLRPYTYYSVIVQAYNNVGAGPRSDEITVRTGESIPSSALTGVSCDSFSPQSISISWNSLPDEYINGVLKGFRVYYRPTDSDTKDLMKNEVTAQQNKLTLYGLRKFTNYSLSVIAFNNVGDSPSTTVFCKTQEDLPALVDTIKAFQSGPDSVVVSWKPPKQPNGVIRKYAIYRKSSNEEEVNSFTVPSHLNYHKTSNLIRGYRYNFWVTAWTSVGEGGSSTIVSVIMATKISARIVSFDDQIEETIGQNVELFCKSVGIPEPEIKWKVNGIVFEMTSHTKNPRLQHLMNGSLRISNTTLNDSGNYSCLVSNIHGFDAITYELNIRRDSNSNYPLSPIVEVVNITTSSIIIKWVLRGQEVLPVKAHEVYFRSSVSKEWKYYIITDENLNNNKTFSIEHLLCGNLYQIYVINVNSYGKSSPSDILNVRTLGREPISPPYKSFVNRINSTSVKLNLNIWKDGGCPYTSHPIVQWKPMETNQWNLLFVNSVLETAIISEFKPNKNYKIKVIMKNSAGTTAVEYDIDPYGLPNNVYHISGHSPVHIAVEHLDNNVSEENEVVPIVFTVVISVILLLAGILAVFILYKAMQKRFNQNTAEDRTPGHTDNIFRKVALIHTNKNGKRISEPMDMTSAEMTSLNSTEDHLRIKAFNKSTESMTTSFQCKEDTKYKYVSIPKPEISDYYSIVHKNRKCKTNAKQTLIIDMKGRDALESPNESPHRYSLPNTMFDKQQQLEVDCQPNQCCHYVDDSHKPTAECVCCSLFETDCCNNGHNWQSVCQFEPNAAQMPSSYLNTKFN
ncbi:cell adhesion molecule DSCAM-like [Oppia nitens]|uniref:cell adhesion molecule DSCAM-like n=1 Tax=Oppia nitens TaxID=1686743 RepID=UPI0023DC972A|nr:cell adhesion molecule DSCAM-like [Oppia nitens]